MNFVQYCKWLTIINGAVPLGMLAGDAARGQLGANPATAALHVTGMLALIFLLLSLVITPLRWWTAWGGWLALRRALGLYSFFYAILHVAIYVAFDRGLNIGSALAEIGLRRFLQVGGLALLLMVPLAITSTNAMQRRLGSKRWKRLHQLTYIIAVLSVAHFYMLVKSDVRLPLAMAGVVAILLGWRVVRVLASRTTPPKSSARKSTVTS